MRRCAPVVLTIDEKPSREDISKTYGGVDVWIHVFLTSALIAGIGQLHVPTALPPGKSSRYALDRRPGGPQNQSVPRGKKKNLDLHRDSLSDPSAIQSLASRYQLR
jgi:hypothetical protein